jgi:hypothetical protein
MPTGAVISNVTMGLSTMDSMSGSMGWFISVIIFLLTTLFLILVVMGFRRIVYGSVALGGLTLVGLFSRWIGKSAQEGDWIPARYYLYVIIFVVLAYIIGVFISKLKFIKEFEENITIDKPKEDILK